MDETSPIPSTSTANISPSTNSNQSPTVANLKRPSSDVSESDISLSKITKCNNSDLNEKFNYFLSKYNKNPRNVTARIDILQEMKGDCFRLYCILRDYFMDRYFRKGKIELGNNNVCEGYVCVECRRKFKKMKRNQTVCITHLFTCHDPEWPAQTDINRNKNLDNKEQITKIIEEVQLNDKVPNRDECQEAFTAAVSPSSEVQLKEKLDECYNLIKLENTAITKEMCDSLKENNEFICKLKNDPNFMNNLLFDAKKSCSLILTKHLLNEEIFLSLILTYISSERIRSLFYRLIKANSDNIDMVNQIENNGLKINKFVGFGFDVTEDQDGIIELTVSTLNNKIENQSNIIINKYMSEPKKAIFEDALAYISPEVEFLITETYNWCQFHNEQELEKKILQSSTLTENVDDVWFLKFYLVSTIVDNWEELKKYFGKIKNPYDRWRIHRLYENKNNMMYLILIQRSLKEVNEFFMFLDSFSVTKDKWEEKLQKMTRALKALENITTEIPRQEIMYYDENKKKFLDSLNVAIDKFLKNNNCAPIAIPIINKKIKEIDSYVKQSIHNFKDNVSADTIDLLEACLQIKFMKAEEGFAHYEQNTYK